ncbi:MAG: membrane protein insertase YidC, partial [Acidobacteria bacterium]|nr:membrane protein insertase YidC [Acidobacteriota bacterium]
MGVVLFTTPYFYRSTAPPPPERPAAPATTAQPAPAAATAPAPASTAAPAPVAAQKAEDLVIETRLHRIRFSNRGATVRSWLLKKYRDRSGNPLELVNIKADKVEPPFSLLFKNRKPPAELNSALFSARRLENGVEFEFSDGRVRASKRFRVKPDGYLAEVATEVTEDGKGVPHAIEWRSGFGDMSVEGAAGAQHVVWFDPSSGKLVTQGASDAKNGPVSSSGPYTFAGLADAYFTAVFLPPGREIVEVTTFSDTVPAPSSAKDESHVGVAVGGAPLNRFGLFVGPKDLDILTAVDPALGRLLDFGWFGFVAKPLFLALHWVHDHLIHNYGWAIILVTIVINFVLFPLKISSMKSMKKMQVLQPQIAAINERYRNISLRDPRKTQQNQEVMELYRRHGVNPAGGCIPLLLQIPFFIALYTVLSVSIELRGAGWLWVDDLSRPEDLDIRILPLAMIASQFWMQKMTPATGMDPAQQKVMLLMPLLMGFMFYGMSSGLVLYWFTGNVVGIAQQLFFNRTAVVTDIQTAPAQKKGKK